MCAITDEARETEGARRDGTSVAENYGKCVLRHVRREQGWLWRLSVYGCGLPECGGLLYSVYSRCPG